MGIKYVIFWICFSVFNLALIAEKKPTVNFTFNNLSALDEISSKSSKFYGVTFVEDRFGNSGSACYLHGSSGSYINLGDFSQLKPNVGSISLWFNIDYPIEAGSGYELNPILLTKCSQSDDFFEAYCINYMYKTHRLGVAVTQSSLNQVGLHSVKPINLGKWHHVVVTFDNHEFAFYLDGRLEGKIKKNFENKYLNKDSVLVGYSANGKNNRFFNGSVDDIMYFDKVLNSIEVEELYKAPNPFKYKIILKYLVYALFLLLIVAFLVFVISYRFKQKFIRENEKNRLKILLKETEIKVLKANMNPHFIFNALNSIQKFVLQNDKINAYKYLIMFSKLLRKMLESNIEESIVLSEEIDILKNYMELESLRFEKSFAYNIFVDDKLVTSKINIPHMLIQPFVENAIWHGLLNKEGDKQLTIKFEYLDETRMICQVEDNGVGRKVSGKQSNEYNKRSLAIKFNEQRLQLIESTKNIKCGFEIVDLVDNDGMSLGTKIIIKIPILGNGKT